MLKIKVRTESGKWIQVAQFHNEDIEAALDTYNSAPTPRMLIGRKILHKQYTNNGFIYTGGPGMVKNA